MRRFLTFGILCFLFLFSVSSVFSQGFTGPGSERQDQKAPDPARPKPPSIPVINNAMQAVLVSHPITVSEARELPHNSWITLTGNIINMLPGGRQYTFRDNSGEIVVDIGPREWRGLSVEAADRVEIFGEVKIRRGQISIRGYAVTGTGKMNTRQGQAVTVSQPVTINEAKELPRDSWVTLTGNIISMLPGGRLYTFRDNSGEIVVNIGSKEWRGLSVDAADKVEISGQVRINKGQIFIIAHAIKKAGV